MTDRLLSMISERFVLTKIDAGEFSRLKVNGMDFHISSYRAEGLGHVSVMRAKGFFGLMRMDTLMLTPEYVDLPLYSYDRIYAMSNDTLIVELYDTLTGPLDLSSLSDVNERYSQLTERYAGEHWYDSIKLPQSISKKAKKAQTAQMDKLAYEHFLAYLSIGANEVSDTSEKRTRSSEYVEGLLCHGGPSTDVFKKALGEEKTARLFREVLFGTCHN